MVAININLATANGEPVIKKASFDKAFAGILQ